MELNQKHRLYRYFYTLILALIAFNSLSITVKAQEEHWEITETFKLSLDSIEWTETQYNPEAGLLFILSYEQGIPVIEFPVQQHIDHLDAVHHASVQSMGELWLI